MKQRIILFISIALSVCGSWAAGKPKPQLLVPMDYSTCGYHASEQRIPDVKNVLYVDKAELLQQAIDEVSAMKPEKRGAILIAEGTYLLDEPLRIKASGVVLRGMGKGKTILVKRGFDRGQPSMWKERQKRKSPISPSINSEISIRQTTGLSRLPTNW